MIDVIPWRDDELVLIAHPDSPFVRRRKVRVQDLADERLIIREAGSGTREVASEPLPGTA
ncbi:MAG: LysR substrate-binding domain-containing protein [Gemmatimonadales bacterium]